MCNTIDFVFPGHKEFLYQILSAINLSPEQNCLIFDLPDHAHASIRQLPSDREFHILSFGLKPQQLELQGFELMHEHYKIRHCNLLFAMPLGDYVNNKTAKGQLWSALKEWIVPKSQ